MKRLALWVAVFVLPLVFAAPVSGQQSDEIDGFNTVDGGPPSPSVWSGGRSTASCHHSLTCSHSVRVTTWFDGRSVDSCTAGSLVNWRCWSDWSAEPYPGLPKHTAASAKINQMNWGCYTGKSEHYARANSGAVPWTFRFGNTTRCFNPPPNCTGSLCQPPQTPLVVPTGKNVEFTNAKVPFDIDADGVLDLVTFPRGKTAWLALDRNSNGKIDNGSELFGSATYPGLHEDGFQALREMAGTGDTSGHVGPQHAIWERLLLWFDKNQDGESQAGELMHVGTHLKRIGLGYFELGTEDPSGAVLLYEGWAEFTDGTTRPIYDVVVRESDRGILPYSKRKQ
jgi:hypothetical protein